MSRLLDTARTIRLLGLPNVMRAVAHKAAVKAGLYRRLTPVGEPGQGPFFAFAQPPAGAPVPEARDWWIKAGDDVLRGDLRFYSDQPQRVGFPPAWNRNPFTQAQAPQKHWS